jgi:hypothetical protein
MQKPYVYTRLFKPLSTYDYRFWDKLEINLAKYITYVELVPIQKSTVRSLEWEFPFGEKPDQDLYNIIILIAQVTGTKIMFKYEIKDPDTLKEKFLIIGENTRVVICYNILNYTLEGIIRFMVWVRKNEPGKAKVKGWSSMTRYIKAIVWDRTTNIIEKFTPLAERIRDKQSEVNLEQFIMEKFKLEYKQYHQSTNMYYNAISKSFRHRRMML